MEQINLEIFAQRLKKLRTERGLSTRALAEEVGTSNATISRYETGKRDPNLIIVHNIAKYFGVSIEYLYGEDIEIELDKKQLNEIFDELSDESKKDVIKYITYLREKERR